MLNVRGLALAILLAVGCSGSSSGSECEAMTEGGTILGCGCGNPCGETGLQVTVDQGDSCLAHSETLYASFEGGDEQFVNNSNGGAALIFDYYLPWPNVAPGQTVDLRFLATGEGFSEAFGETEVVAAPAELVELRLAAPCQYIDLPQ